MGEGWKPAMPGRIRGAGVEVGGRGEVTVALGRGVEVGFRVGV